MELNGAIEYPSYNEDIITCRKKRPTWYIDLGRLDFVTIMFM